MFDILLKPESSFSYMPTNTKRKRQLNTEIAKGHRGKEREHTDDELSKTEKGKSSLHLLKIKNIATRCRTSVWMLWFVLIICASTWFFLLTLSSLCKYRYFFAFPAFLWTYKSTLGVIKRERSVMFCTLAFLSTIGQNLQVNDKIYFQLHRHRAMNMTDTINHMISFLHYPKIDPHKMAEFEISWVSVVTLFLWFCTTVITCEGMIHLI